MDIKSLVNKATTLARDNSDKLRKLGPVGDKLAGLVGGKEDKAKRPAPKTAAGPKRSTARKAKPARATASK